MSKFENIAELLNEIAEIRFHSPNHSVHLVYFIKKSLTPLVHDGKINELGRWRRYFLNYRKILGE